MIRVVHVIPEDGLGGVEVAAQSMAARDDLSCDFHLLLIAGGSVASGNARVRASPFRSSLNPLASLLCAWRVVRLRPDVLVCSLWRSVPVALLVRMVRPGIKLVFSLNSERTVHVFDRLFSRAGVAAADEVWADSRATLRGRLKDGQARSRTISFVASRLRPSATPSGGAAAPSFVVWARIMHEKGLDRAIRIIALLTARGIDATFDVWGPDRGAEHDLRNLADELGIADRIRFRGTVDRADLPVITGDSCFFLQPSRLEGMAMACVEAMQLGLVPVVTAVGEMGEYVRNGETGIVVDPERVDHAADHIQRLIADPEEYARLRSRAIARWQDAPLYADDICRASRELAAGGRSRLQPAHS